MSINRAPLYQLNYCVIKKNGTNRALDPAGSTQSTFEEQVYQESSDVVYAGPSADDLPRAGAIDPGGDGEMEIRIGEWQPVKK